MVPIESITSGEPRSVHSFVLSANLDADAERKKAGGDIVLQRDCGRAGQLEARHEDWCGPEGLGGVRVLHELGHHVRAPEFCPAQVNVFGEVQCSLDPHVPNPNP